MMINKRISRLSSDKDSFNSSAQIYDQALNHSKYESKFHYIEDNHPNSAPKRNRGRNIIWFNPPYSKNVRTSVGKEFLRLINKHFPKTSNIHKIFNKNTVKVSYSCMNNVKQVICGHNRKVFSNLPSTSLSNERECNCKNENECPLERKCMMKEIVYNAEITA